MARVTKYKIKDFKEIAKGRGGKCLSRSFVNLAGELEWECGRGHRWQSAARNILYSKSWCPECVRRAKKTIEDMRELAAEKGGECHSKVYRGNKESLNWSCGEGHRWTARPDMIVAGTWCPECAGKQTRSLKEIRKIAREKGGKILSKRYENHASVLELECGKGHRWRATAKVIVRGTWCPECVGVRKKTIVEMRKMAREKGGKCLSRSYENNHTAMKWECGRGHRWSTIANTIVSGSWCPRCALEDKVGSKRGVWKYTLQDMKELAASKGGVCLSRKYLNSSETLKWKCENGHSWHAKPASIRSGGWCPECAGVARGSIKKMQVLGRERGLKCLSEKYVNVSTALLWQCKKGHKFKEAPLNIRNRKKGCRLCQDGPASFTEMRGYARERGGRCLSSEYVNARTSMEWRCKKGHTFERNWDKMRLVKGEWCPYCSGLIQDIDDMQVLAKKRFGKCLSKAYVNSATKLLWQCENKHRWEATPNNIGRGRWCPYCHNESKSSEPAARKVRRRKLRV